MDYNYLVPANSKKQTLFLGIFAPSDIPIVIIGAMITVILIVLVGTSTFWKLIIDMLPIALAAFLVFPMPNYHNVRTFITPTSPYIFSTINKVEFVHFFYKCSNIMIIWYWKY